MTSLNCTSKVKSEKRLPHKLRFSEDEPLSESLNPKRREEGKKTISFPEVRERVDKQKRTRVDQSWKTGVIRSEAKRCQEKKMKSLVRARGGRGDHGRVRKQKEHHLETR